MENTAWVYNHERLASIHPDIDVEHLAVNFPDAIYFYAGMVEHPDYEDRNSMKSGSREYHDEHTMRRVREALLATGMPPHKAEECIRSMQTYGILFRQRL